MPYLGNEPAVAFTSTTKDSFSGDASTTDFTMSKSANVNAVRVVVENVVQNPTVAYTCSGTTLSFTSAPPTGTNNIYVVHLGPPAATVAPPTTINNNTTFTGGVSLKNETPEDTDGGRESLITFKGLQSGQEESTLAQIQASHDGTSDDQKADLIFRTNDGSDGTSPTEAMRINSAQNVGIGVSPTTAYGHVLQVHDTGTAGASLRLTDSNSGAGTGNGGELLQLNTAMYLMNRENGLLSFSTNDEQVQVIDADGNTTFPKQPAFQVNKGSNTQANFAVGSDVLVTFGTERFDVGSNFASNTFTAPVTGKYVFSVLLRVDSLDIDSNYYIPFIETSNHRYRFITAPKFSSDPAYYSFTLTCLADMDANDTCVIKINQGTGAAASDISGDPDYTWWTGYLAC